MTIDTTPDTTATSVLTSLFAGLDGHYAIRANETGPQTFDNLDATTGFAEAATGDVDLSLATRDPAEGTRLEQRAIAAMIPTDTTPAVPPSLILRHDTDGVMGIWLLQAPLDVRGGGSRYPDLDVFLQTVSGDGDAGIEDSIPFPGCGGWVIEDHAAPILYDVAALRIKKMNDVIVHGEVDEAFLSRKIEIGASADGAQTKSGRWKVWKTDIRGFLNKFLEHKVGEKDGHCFLQGPPLDGKRQASAIPPPRCLGWLAAPLLRPQQMFFSSAERRFSVPA